ncbi:MAG: ABC transporter ATP-binding protein [Sumerlaeia bacterium]
MPPAADTAPAPQPAAESAPSPAISIRDVSKSYGTERKGQPPVPVLRGVSLDVRPGEFVSLMGSSGSGKTTLLNMVGGLDVPDAGIVTVAGQNLARLTDKQRSEFRLRHIGFVFQFFNLLPNLTVRENIALPLLFQSRPARDADAAAASVEEEVGLGGKGARRISQLSGGEMQRVALARALIHRPAVLLADEPTGNLDSRTGETILALIRNLAQEHGATVLMATHDLAATQASDRVVRMRDGQVVSGDDAEGAA